MSFITSANGNKFFLKSFWVTIKEIIFDGYFCLIYCFSYFSEEWICVRNFTFTKFQIKNPIVDKYRRKY